MNDSLFFYVKIGLKKSFILRVYSVINSGYFINYQYTKIRLIRLGLLNRDFWKSGNVFLKKLEFLSGKVNEGIIEKTSVRKVKNNRSTAKI